MSKQLRIANVQPVAGTYALLIQWRDGGCQVVDLIEIIRTYSVLKPLEDLEQFRLVKVGQDGFDVSWGDGVELCSTTLHRLALV